MKHVIDASPNSSKLQFLHLFSKGGWVDSRRSLHARLVSTRTSSCLTTALCSSTGRLKYKTTIYQHPVNTYSHPAVDRLTRPSAPRAPSIPLLHVPPPDTLNSTSIFQEITNPVPRLFHSSTMCLIACWQVSSPLFEALRPVL